MKAATFTGGLKLPPPPPTEHSIEKFSNPPYLILPLKQDLGDVCEPLVKKGQTVSRGSMLAQGPASTILAPYGGKISKLDKSYALPSGEKVPALHLEKDEDVGMAENIIQDQDRLDKFLFSGLVDFSTVPIPLLDKISQAQRQQVQTVIISALDECFVNGAKGILVQNNLEEILTGASIIKDLLRAQKVYLAVYESTFSEIPEADNEKIKIVPLKAKHPQHHAKLLIKAICNRELSLDMLPEDLGITILDIETIYRLARLNVFQELPLEKLITISGAGLSGVKHLEVPLGTPISAILEHLGVDSANLKKVIINGPLTGQAIYDLDFPVTKGVQQIYLQNKEQVIEYGTGVCVKCGYCVQVCPMHLMPLLIAGYSQGGALDLAEKNEIFSCIECGSCAFVCPVNIPMVQWIKLGKAEIASARQETT